MLGGHVGETNMEPIYSKEGEEQYLDIRFKFKIKHNPGTKSHLIQLFESYLAPKGVPMEDSSHKIEIL